MTYRHGTLRERRLSLCWIRAFEHLAWTCTDAQPPLQLSRLEVPRFVAEHRRPQSLGVLELEGV